MNIRHYRLKKGYSQEQIARLLGISLRQYQNVEKGVSLPNVITGLRLAIILNVDPYKLFSVSKSSSESQRTSSPKSL